MGPPRLGFILQITRRTLGTKIETRLTVAMAEGISLVKTLDQTIITAAMTTMGAMHRVGLGKV